MATNYSLNDARDKFLKENNTFLFNRNDKSYREDLFDSEREGGAAQYGSALPNTWLQIRDEDVRVGVCSFAPSQALLNARRHHTHCLFEDLNKQMGQPIHPARIGTTAGASYYVPLYKGLKVPEYEGWTPEKWREAALQENEKPFPKEKLVDENGCLLDIPVGFSDPVPVTVDVLVNGKQLRMVNPVWANEQQAKAGLAYLWMQAPPRVLRDESSPSLRAPAVALCAGVVQAKDSPLFWERVMPEWRRAHLGERQNQVVKMDKTGTRYEFVDRKTLNEGVAVNDEWKTHDGREVVHVSHPLTKTPGWKWQWVHETPFLTVCNAWEPVGETEMFIECLNYTTTTVSAVGIQEQEVTRVTTLGAKKEVLHTKRSATFSLCDLCALKKFVWFCVLFNSLAGVNAQATDIASVAWGINFLLLCVALVVVSVGAAITYAILMLTKRLSGFLEESTHSLCVVRLTVVDCLRDIKKFCNDYMWWQKVNFGLTMFSVFALPLLVGFAAPVPAPVAASSVAPTFRPEGRFRQNLHSWMRWLLLFVGAASLGQAAMQGPKEAKEGFQAWIPFLKDSGYVVWFLSHTKRFFKNVWNGRKWNDGFDQYPDAFPSSNPNDVRSAKEVGLPRAVYHKYEEAAPRIIQTSLNARKTRYQIQMDAIDSQIEAADRLPAVVKEQRLLQLHERKEALQEQHEKRAAEYLRVVSEDWNKRMGKHVEAGMLEVEDAEQSLEESLQRLEDLERSDGFQGMPSQNELMKFSHQDLYKALQTSLLEDDEVYVKQPQLATSVANPNPQCFANSELGELLSCSSPTSVLSKISSILAEPLFPTDPGERADDSFSLSNRSVNLLVAVLRRFSEAQSTEFMPLEGDNHGLEFSSLSLWEAVTVIRVGLGCDALPFAHRVLERLSHPQPDAVFPFTYQPFMLLRTAARPVGLITTLGGQTSKPTEHHFLTTGFWDKKKLLRYSWETYEKTPRKNVVVETVKGPGPTLGSAAQRELREAQAEVSVDNVTITMFRGGEAREFKLKEREEAIENGWEPNKRIDEARTCTQFAPQGGTFSAPKIVAIDGKDPDEKDIDDFLEQAKQDFEQDVGTFEKFRRKACVVLWGEQPSTPALTMKDWTIAVASAVGFVAVCASLFLAGKKIMQQNDDFVEEARSGIHGPRNLKVRRLAQTPSRPKRSFEHSSGSESTERFEKVVESTLSPMEREFEPHSSVDVASDAFAKRLRSFANEIPTKYTTKFDKGVDLEAVQSKLNEIADEVDSAAYRSQFEKFSQEDVVVGPLTTFARDLRGWSSDVSSAVRDIGQTLKATQIQSALLDVADALESSSDLPDWNPPRKPHPPARKVQGVRLRRAGTRRGKTVVHSSFVPESALGKAKINLEKIQPRLFKLTALDPGLLLTSERWANAWLVGNKLVTTWHTISHLCGKMIGKDLWEVDGKFKAVGARMTFEKAGKIGKLPCKDSNNDDLGFLEVSVPVALSRVPMQAPVAGEPCCLVAWDNFDDEVPSISLGAIDASGLHTCASIEGNCGGILVSSLTGSILGFHNGGGTAINRATPIHQALLDRLATDLPTHPLN